MLMVDDGQTSSVMRWRRRRSVRTVEDLHSRPLGSTRTRVCRVIASEGRPAFHLHNGQ